MILFLPDKGIFILKAKDILGSCVLNMLEE
jgi:hypothetical protein